MGYPITRTVGRLRGTSGFTLVELLTALVVMGVAVSIFLSLYIASLDLAQTRRGQGVAAKLAEEQLVAIQANPSAYAWPDFAAAGAGTLVALSNKGKGEFPVAMPTSERARNREKNLHEDCTWEVHARLPQETANYIDVVVIVRWEHKGRPQVFTLSSTLPRGAVEAAA